MVLPRLPDGQSVPPPRSSKKKSPSSTASSQYDSAAVPSAQEAVATAVAAVETASQWSYMPAPEAMLEDRLLEEVNSDPEVIDAREQLNQALRDQREAAIGVDPNRLDKPVQIKKQVDRLTRKEYRRLSPLQKDAVDFNGELVAAIRKDKRLADTYNPTPEQRETYGEALKKVFPTISSGSTEYAPETLALLRQVGFSDEQADLDDFLHLDAAIKAKDLKRLEPQAPEPSGPVRGKGAGDGGGGNLYNNPLTGDRVGMVERLARGQTDAEAALENGNRLLQALDVNLLAEDRETDVRLLGGAPTTEATIPGFGKGDLDKYFQQAFTMLTDKQYDPERVFGSLQVDLDEKQRGAFMDYVQSRLAGAVEEAGGGRENSADFRSPLTIAKLLGLVQGKPTKGGSDGGSTTPEGQGQEQGYSQR